MREIQYTSNKLLRLSGQIGAADMRPHVLQQKTIQSVCIAQGRLSISHEHFNATPNGLDMT